MTLMFEIENHRSEIVLDFEQLQRTHHISDSIKLCAALRSDGGTINRLGVTASGRPPSAFWLIIATMAALKCV